MFPIPMYVKLEDFQSALRHMQPKPPEKPIPSSVELGKSISKGISIPPQEESKADTRYYPAPYRACFGLGGSGGD